MSKQIADEPQPNPNPNTLELAAEAVERAARERIGEALNLAGPPSVTFETSTERLSTGLRCCQTQKISTTTTSTSLRPST
jgi:hypothetical protein